MPIECTKCGKEFDGIDDIELRECWRCIECCDEEHSAKCTKE